MNKKNKSYWGSLGKLLHGISCPLLILGFWPGPAAAYIDPGTGSALLYVVAGVVVSVYFATRGLYYRLVESIFRARNKHQKCNIAVHCENPRYEITFLPILWELDKNRVDVTFFTMYPRNESFDRLPSGVVHREIGSGMVGYSQLNFIEANLLVTTTPQIDVMMFRRSKRVKHYCHIPHAIGESMYVRPYSYDFFDSVFCCGPILKANIRRIEQIRGLPEKRLYDTGVPHYDELIKGIIDVETCSSRKTVLFAPSWGPLSTFQAFGTDFIPAIAERYNVLVRPHPQMKISQPEVYKKIHAMENVVIDTHTTPAEAMSQADLLVSDISGIMHEFVFIHEKPVIIIDHDTGLGGLEGDLLGGKSELKERCREIILPILPSQLSELANTIETVLEQPPSNRIAEVRDSLVYNFGQGGAVAATQIQEILKCL